MTYSLFFLGVLGLVLCQLTLARGELRLPSILGDHMVFQQGMPIVVWGWGKPGEEVKVSLDGMERKGKVYADGKWMVKLPARPAGGPYEVKITSGEDEITLKDVLIGEVWVCSGQSNMEWPVAASNNAQEEISRANYPQIRLFTVPHSASLTPEEDCEGKWEVCSPNTVGAFSAVAYFFGREIHERLKVPIGLIHTSWGGTPAEAWTDLETLRSDPDLSPLLERIPKDPVDMKELQKEYDRKLGEWFEKAFLKDPGNKGESLGWAKAEFNDSDWQGMDLPRFWEDHSPQMSIDGAVWFRKAISLPREWANKDLVLELGAIDDFDVTYFNGEKIGSTGAEVPNSAVIYRRYLVPGRLVKEGVNLIAVRVFDNWGTGGFGGPSERMRLSLADDPNECLPLAGEWKFKVEFARPASEVPPWPELSINPSWVPTALYNAMIHPLLPFRIRGAIWYQGESNADRAYQYRKLFPAMIEGWRRNWKEGDFPFLFVQLANFMARQPEPTESAWAELREAQLLTLKTVPNTGMAVAIDIGDANDIHPRNKQDVGKRLALWALALTYGQKVEYSGPIYREMRIEGDKIRIFFDHVDGGLVAKGGELKGFAIAGADRKFYWARARIEGDTVVVWSEKVPQPVAVRYAWADNPDCNLYNKAGLPASPFRTDDWHRAP